MQRAVADVVVGQLALEGVAEDVGERLDEVDVAGAERRAADGRVQAEHAERGPAALDRHRQPAAGAERRSASGERAKRVSRSPVGDDRPGAPLRIV